MFYLYNLGCYLHITFVSASHSYHGLLAMCSTWTILGWSLHSKGNRSNRRCVKKSQMKYLGWSGMAPVIFDLLMNVINKYNYYFNDSEQWHQIHFHPYNLKLLKSIMILKTIFPTVHWCSRLEVYFTLHASNNFSQIQWFFLKKNHCQKNQDCNSMVHRSLFSKFR